MGGHATLARGDPCCPRVPRTRDIRAVEARPWRGVGTVDRALHSRRYFHKDLYLCHFYIPTDFTRTQGQMHMIDLHRLAHHPWSRRFWQIKDLAQLAYSSEIEGVSAGDRLRFWRAYLGPGYRGRAARLLGWFVCLKWRRYRRHNKKKQNLAMEMIRR
jgi:Lipopolysaccharide kinase (Kdo/WaaP) family